MSRYDTWMLPESHKVKPTVSNQAFLKKHLKMLRRGLDTYYSSIPYSDKEHTRQETEEKLAVYIADKGAQLCDEWEKYSIHLLIDYFFYKDILTVRTALLLHMYALLKKLEYKKPSDDAKPSAKHAKEARTPLAPTLIWGDLTLFLHRVVKAVRPGALALLSEYLCKMILEIGKTADCLTYKVLKSGVSEFIGSEFEDDDFGAK